jgi:cell division protein ZapA
VSTVTLSIGPKSYTIACADGEEAHIASLGAMIAEKYAQLGTARAPLEAQNLLFAALFLADELAEARRRAESAPAPTPAEAPQADPGEIASLRARVEELEAQLAEARALPAPTPAPQADLFAGAPPAGPDTDALAARLEALAERAEANAAALEAAVPNA